MMETQVIQSLLEQAPAVGAVLVLVIVFLRHIRSSDEANREVMLRLRDAIDELRKEIRYDREHPPAGGRGDSR